MRIWVAAFALVAAAGCASGVLPPAALDSRSDTCRTCRMVVSDQRFAAQIVAPGEEPVFFDDLGCLRSYLAEHATPPGGAIYVADHRTGAWVAAGVAVYTRVHGTSTPMNGGMTAHADATSRDSDAVAAGGTDVPRADVIVTAGGRQ